MKTILSVALLLVFAAVAAVAQTVTIGQFVTLNSSTSSPVALTNTVIRATRVTFIGKKDNRTANTGTVYIGATSTNDQQPIEVASGATVSLNLPANTVIDLSKLYLDVATANDGVLVLYQ